MTGVPGGDEGVLRDRPLRKAYQLVGAPGGVQFAPYNAFGGSETGTRLTGRGTTSYTLKTLKLVGDRGGEPLNTPRRERKRVKYNLRYCKCMELKELEGGSREAQQKVANHKHGLQGKPERPIRETGKGGERGRGVLGRNAQVRMDVA